MIFHPNVHACKRPTKGKVVKNLILVAILATLALFACACRVPENVAVPPPPPPPTTSHDAEFVAMANQTELEKSAVQRIIELASHLKEEIPEFLCVEVSKFKDPVLEKMLWRDLLEGNELPNPPANAPIAFVLFCGEDHPELAVGLDKNGLLVAMYD